MTAVQLLTSLSSGDEWCKAVLQTGLAWWWGDLDQAFSSKIGTELFCAQKQLVGTRLDFKKIKHPKNESWLRDRVLKAINSIKQ